MCVKHSAQGLDCRKSSVEGFGVVGRQEIVWGRKNISLCLLYASQLGKTDLKEKTNRSSFTCALARSIPSDEQPEGVARI